MSVSLAPKWAGTDSTGLLPGCCALLLAAARRDLE